MLQYFPNRRTSFRLSYCVSAVSMHTNISFFDTGPGIDLVNLTLLPLQWTNCIKRGTVPHRSTETQEPLRMEGTILHQVRRNDVCIRAWFCIVRNLAVNMLLCTSFIDRFIHGIFPAKRKAVP